MLKILEKNWVGEALKAYWKQYAGSVIDLKNKSQDPLVRSELIVILLQIAFAIVILLFSYVFFTYLYRDILQTVVTSLMEGISAGGFNGESNILDTLDIIKANNFLIFSSIFLALTVLFTFLIAKMTLRPAKNALNLQKRFISDVAHELRTPLAVIKTSNEVALMNENIDPKIREVLKDGIDELDRMSEIINNVLSFNSLFRPKRIKFDNVDLGPLVDSAIRKLKDLAGKKNLEITVKKVTPHIVWGSTVALEQVINNLLKNAINYTPEDGHITVRIGPDYYGNTLLHIEDTGIGISKKDLMHIFEPFYRAERSRSRSTGSSGLGLTIASEIVKMHSGRLTIRSAENKGTVAIVTLPYNKNIKEEKSMDLSTLSEISINFLRNK